MGAGLRYLLLLAGPEDALRAPVIILIENVVGAFLLGVLTGVVVARKIKEWPWMAFAGTGILGSFTTFSTLAMDFIFISESSLLMALTYGFGSIMAGLVAAIVGLRIGKGGTG